LHTYIEGKVFAIVSPQHFSVVDLWLVPHAKEGEGEGEGEGESEGEGAGEGEVVKLFVKLSATQIRS